MSNNKPNIFQVIFKKIFGTGKSSAVTSKTNEVILKRVNMHILEMEDVLFHLNSAVMMPENPEGKSSKQGSGASEEQKKVTGLKVLALVYKQYEFDPNIKMVITGHTDTSGTAEFNFKLSDERAQNILYLLYRKDEEDSKSKWAEVCYNRQKVEDYQQIMKYFKPKLNCECDCGKIDNKWGTRTKKATDNFFKKVIPEKAAQLLLEVTSDSKKRWPEEAWAEVYKLYSKEIADTLEITEVRLEGLRKTSIKFVDDKKPILGCGESFPIDKKYKDKYRSQKNRRVELLFFDKEEAPDLNCPAEVKKVHTEDQCPLWKKFYFIPLYIDPNDLYAVVYHFKFMYYDRIKKKQMPVPEGLEVKAFEDGNKEIPTETIFKKDVYQVKVKFVNKIKDPARTKFYFEFGKQNQWVFTKDDGTDPVIETKTAEDINKLEFAERIKYYDLPAKWSSQNYWTRFESDITKNGRFEKVFKDTHKLKPFGDETTKPDKPLVFSLDDIVLVDKDGKQDVKDKDKNDTAKILSDDSRYTLYYVKEEDLVLYKPETDEPYFTNYKFKENLVKDIPTDGQPRLIIFANDFYSVSDQRAGQAVNTFDAAKKQIKGCRAASVKDPNYLCSMKVKNENHYVDTEHITLTAGSTTATGTGTKFLKDVEPGYRITTYNGTTSKWNTKQQIVQSVQSDTRLTLKSAPAASENNAFFQVDPHNLFCTSIVGNFELHYIHNGCLIKEPDKAGGNKVRSFFLVYWNGRFVKPTRVPADPKTHIEDAELKTFTKGGMPKSKERWENKGYTIEAQTLDAAKKGQVQIKPVFHFEAKKTNTGGKHKCTVTITNDTSDGEMGISASKMYKKSWGDPTYNDYGRGEQIDIDGKRYKELVVAHELGHATGKYDDYEYSGGELHNSEQNYFRQWYPGMPYHFDFKSMMWYTEAPRMKHLWFFVNRLNSASKKDSELKKILNETQYKLVHRYTKRGANKTLNYYLADSPNDYRDIHEPFKKTETTFTAAVSGNRGSPAVPPRQGNPGRPAIPPRPAVQGKGISTLMLYKMSEDELSWSIKINNRFKGFAFDGILVVFIKIAFKFSKYKYRTAPSVGHPTGEVKNRSWTNNRKTVWMNAVKSKIKSLNGCFYLENNGTNKDFRRTYLFFFPICLDLNKVAADAKANEATSPNADFSKAHYTIDVIRNLKDTVPQPTNNNELEVGSSVSRHWVARYIFGQDASWTGAAVNYKGKDDTSAGRNVKVRSIPNTTVVTYQADDMNFTRDWLKTVLADNSFTLKGTAPPP